MDQIKPSTTIYGDMSARALVETVEDLMLRVEQLERELKELREYAENNSTSDLEYKVEEIRSHLELDF